MAVHPILSHHGPKVSCWGIGRPLVPTRRATWFTPIVLLGGLLIISAIGALAQSAANVSIVFTNSINAEVNGVTSGGVVYGGYSRVKTALDRLQAEAPAGSNVIRLHVSNAVATTMFTQYFRGSAEKVLMGMTGFEFTSMATRDMLTPLDTLATNFYTGANFSLLCTDCFVPSDHPLFPVIRRFIVRVINGVRVVFVSFRVQDQCVKTTTCVANNRTIFQVRGTPQDWINQIRFEQRADFLFVLGLGSPDDISIDTAILNTLTSIDLALSYDVDTLTNAPLSVRGTPLWNTFGTGGMEVARLDVELVPGRPLRLFNATKIRTMQCANETAPSHGCSVMDPVVQAQVNTYMQQVTSYASTVLGSTSVAIPIAGCRAGECLLNNMVTDAVLWDTRQRCDHVFLNAGSLRTSFAQGPITVGDIRTLLPFQDRVTFFRIRGRDLVDAMANGVSRAESSSGRFPAISGMRVDFNGLRRFFHSGDGLTWGLRLAALKMWNASTSAFEDVDMNRWYRMCSNQFLLGGGDGYTGFSTLTTDKDFYGPQLDDILTRYIQSRPSQTISPVIDGRMNNVTSPTVLAGQCVYPSIFANATQGSVADYCAGGRRASSNATFIIRPASSTPILSINTTLAGLTSGLTTSANDWIAIYAGTTTAAAPITLTINNTQVVANWTASKPFPTTPLVIYASSLVVQYVSTGEKVGEGLVVNYQALTSCPNGFEESMVNNTKVCTECAPGRYRYDSMSTCTPCPAGTYTNVPGGASCVTCVSPYYCPDTGTSKPKTCEFHQGYAWVSPSVCACPQGTVQTAAGCELQSTGLVAGVAAGVIVLFMVVGALWYRKRVITLRNKALGRRHLRQIKVVSKKTQVQMDVAKSAAFALLDCVEVAFDWNTFASFKDSDVFRIVYAGVALFSTIVVLLAIILRIQGASKLYDIATKGVEVLQSREKKRLRRGMSAGDTADKAAEMTEQLTQKLGEDPEFVETVRKLHMTRQKIHHTLYVALPGVLKSFPVAVVEVLMAEAESRAPIMLMGAFGTSMLSLALNMYSVGEWYTLMDEYRRLKLLVDKKLKEQGVARASATDGGASRGTMKTLQRVPDPNHPKEAANATAAAAHPPIMATGAITEGTTGTPNGTMPPVLTTPPTTDVDGHAAAAVATPLPPTLPRASSGHADGHGHAAQGHLHPPATTASSEHRRSSIAIVTPDQSAAAANSAGAGPTPQPTAPRSRIKIVDPNQAGDGGAGSS